MSAAVERGEVRSLRIPAALTCARYRGAAGRGRYLSDPHRAGGSRYPPRSPLDPPSWGWGAELEKPNKTHSPPFFNPLCNSSHVAMLQPAAEGPLGFPSLQPPFCFLGCRKDTL